MRLEVEREVLAPVDVVWDVLVTWELQPQWMLDAIDVEVLTAAREGVGVVIRCPTRLLGVTVDDVMRVTAWEPQHRLAVAHLGRIITGEGAFELERLPCDSTRILWWEEVDPPLGALGEWGATTVVLPWMRRLFSRSLANLGELAEARARN